MKTAESKSNSTVPQQQKAGANAFFSREGSEAVLDESTSFFGADSGRNAFFNAPPPLQRKLTIGAPDDAYEKEADATAEKVVQRLSEPALVAQSGMVQAKADPIPVVQRVPAGAQRKCATCEKEEELQKKEEERQPEEKLQRKPIFDSPPAGTDDEGSPNVQRKCAACEKEAPAAGPLQRQADAAASATATDGLSARLQSSKGGGSALPPDLGDSMGHAMGADFSGVRVHTGSEAADMSQSIHAQAFTHGQDIYFNEGKYNPGSTDGQKLLAHELTHTVQQGSEIRRFGSLEHKQIGDLSTGNRTYPMNTPGGYYQFNLTHGDIIALSGDYFDPRDYDSSGRLNPDGLFVLAKRPSLDPGKQVGTQDEIVYAIYKFNPGDGRFMPNGIWNSLNNDESYSDEVKKAHDSRYLRLASQNIEHFVSPAGSATRNGLGNSAGGSYRALHEQAIVQAFLDGSKGDPIQESQMREAAAQHFLTDAFSAGHIRTPRQANRTFWRAKYPLFFGNLKKQIALDVAKALNESLVGYFKTIPGLYQDILKKVKEKTSDMPELGIDDLVSMMAHDMDNELGLWVVNDLGYKWQTFGDSNLAPNVRALLNGSFVQHFREFDMISSAVKRGLMDIQFAYDFAKENPHVTDNNAIYNHVKLMGTGLYIFYNKYAPELYMPRMDPDQDNGVQNSTAASFEELWDMQIRTDQPTTYGQAITKSVINGEIGEKLAGLANKFPEVESYIAFPRLAYQIGFLIPFQSDPKTKLLQIINFDPSDGLFFTDTDDAVMDENLSTTEMQGLTVQQRVTRIKNLLDGWTTDREESKIVELFRYASASDRREVYKGVEGHIWSGDWKHGWLVIDDDLWDDLSRENLRTVKGLLNEGYNPRT